MLDSRLLRTDLETVAARQAARGFSLDTGRLAELEERRKALQVRTQDLQAERNRRSKSIGKAKAAGEDIQPLLAAVADLGEQLKAAEAELNELQAELTAIALGIPNLPHASVPVGKDEQDNVEIRRWGEPPRFDFQPLDHADLGAHLGLMNFDQGAKLAGSRFTVLSGPLARLHRALAQFMLDTQTGEHGYTELNVPFLVNAETLTGTSAVGIR